MDTYYKPTANLNQHDTVQIISIGQEEKGKFGPQYQCEVSVNGSAMKWTMSLSKKTQLTEAGFKAGDTVLFEKWKDGVKKGYNFKSAGSHAYAQPTQQPQATQSAQQPTPPPPTSQHETAQPMPNLAGRGAAWNNALIFELISFISNKEPEEELKLEQLLKRVEETAEKIAPHQSKFVNK